MKTIYSTISLTLLTLALNACGGGSGDIPAASTTNNPVSIAPLAASEEELGRKLFFDTNLSTPAGQACASCHDPAGGFADPDATRTAPVSEGVVSGRFGNRNAPTAAYAAFIPERTLQTDPNGGNDFYQGGLFLDGRRDTLAEQAGDPFLNPTEMANPDKAAVVNAVKASDYAGMMVYLNGENIFDDVDAAYAKITEAIAAFERTDELNPFTSKYDYFLSGQATLSDAEENGLRIFQNDGMCSNCHTLTDLADGSTTVFSDFRYWNLGVPANPDNPDASTDYGLGGDINVRSEYGKFRTPTLRNVELTAPYMHNGVFNTLEEVVSFYNTRDDASMNWPAPEVDDNKQTADVGELFLSAQDEADLVAFLKTLTDGYTPP